MLLDVIFPDIHARFEIARNKVLMVSGSDEHGTPITVSAEQNNVKPQDIVDEYHEINYQALQDLGCIWAKILIKRLIMVVHYSIEQLMMLTKMIQDNFKSLYEAGFFETKVMEQY